MKLKISTGWTAIFCLNKKEVKHWRILLPFLQQFAYCLVACTFAELSNTSVQSHVTTANVVAMYFICHLSNLPLILDRVYCYVFSSEVLLFVHLYYSHWLATNSDQHMCAVLFTPNSRRIVQPIPSFSSRSHKIWYRCTMWPGIYFVLIALFFGTVKYGGNRRVFCFLLT